MTEALIENQAFEIGGKNLSTRIQEYTIPAARADIYPIALVIVSTFMHYFKFKEIHCSNFALRLGVLHEELHLP